MASSRALTGRSISVFTIFLTLLWVAGFLPLVAFYSQKVYPGGSLPGTALGVLGTLCMIVMHLYSVRKRISWFRGLGMLSNWLRFHIFLGLFGPMLITFHTGFKFGGIVAVSYWSMVCVVLSGIIGRFIYLWIPRNKEGKELSLQEVASQAQELEQVLQKLPEAQGRVVEEAWKVNHHAAMTKNLSLLKGFLLLVRETFTARGKLKHLRTTLSEEGTLSAEQQRDLLELAARKLRLSHEVAFYALAHRLFSLWHIVHKPFTWMMFLFLIVHVAVVFLFGFNKEEFRFIREFLGR